MEVGERCEGSNDARPRPSYAAGSRAVDADAPCMSPGWAAEDQLMGGGCAAERSVWTVDARAVICWSVLTRLFRQMMFCHDGARRDAPTDR